MTHDFPQSVSESKVPDRRYWFKVRIRYFNPLVTLYSTFLPSFLRAKPLSAAIRRDVDRCILWLLCVRRARTTVRFQSIVQYWNDSAWGGCHPCARCIPLTWFVCLFFLPLCWLHRGVKRDRSSVGSSKHLGTTSCNTDVLNPGNEAKAFLSEAADRRIDSNIQDGCLWCKQEGCSSGSEIPGQAGLGT